MKVMITGVSGLLGSEAKSFFSGYCKVVVVSRQALDDFDLLKNLILDCQPDVFLHCAALTDVEYCESHVEESFLVNTLLPIEIARICKDSGTKYVFVSSTGVYGGEQLSPHSEFENPAPPTVHHLNKFYAELGVLKCCPDALIIRTGWLFGGHAGMKKNFVVNRIAEAEGSEIIYSNSEQFGSPTYSRDVVSAIAELLNADMNGTFNCINKGCVSRYEYVKRIVELSDVDCKVMPTTAAHFKRKAKVSANECAAIDKLNSHLEQPMPNWDDALERYINNL